MAINTPDVKVFNAVLACGSSGRGRLVLRWINEVDKDMASLGVPTWRHLARERNARFVKSRKWLSRHSKRRSIPEE